MFPTEVGILSMYLTMLIDIDNSIISCYGKAFVALELCARSLCFIIAVISYDHQFRLNFLVLCDLIYIL